MVLQLQEVSLLISRLVTTHRLSSVNHRNNSHLDRTVKCQKRNRQLAPPRRFYGTIPLFNSSNSNRACSCLPRHKTTRRWHWIIGDKLHRKIRTWRMISDCLWVETSTICSRVYSLVIHWLIQATRSSLAAAPHNQIVKINWPRVSSQRISNYHKQVI